MEYKLIAPRQDNTTLLEQILLNRGFKNRQEIQNYLNTDESSILNPLLLDNMQEGVIILINHIKQGDKALIIVDSDADGYTSSAILLNYLNNFFPYWVQNKVEYFIHSGKQHGLEDTLQEYDWLSKNIRLIIAPDSSSNDYECHKKLKEHNVDCLILDHHETDGGYSQYACTINNQLSKDYSNKALCGAGVVWQFCRYIDSIMHTQYAINYEDLAALGLIGDMMDNRSLETHYIIKDGLQRIRNPFFVEMMNRQKYQFEGGVTPFGIAFYIVPYINAMTRSGTMEEKYLMFEAMLEWRSDELIPSTKKGYKGQVESRHEQAGRVCINVKSRQKRIQDNNLQYIEYLIKEQHLLDNKILIVRVPEAMIDKNLAGLIANQLAAKYARPTLVLRETHVQNDIIEVDDNYNYELSYNEDIIIYSGSGRNYGRSRLENFRDFCNRTGYVIFAQGHASAFGIAIKENDFDKFVKITNQELANFDFSPCYYVDLEVPADKLNDQEVFAIGSNADLWGQGMEEPLIAITDIKVDSSGVQYMGADKKTLKLTFPGRRTNMIKFHISDEQKELLNPQGGTLTLTAIGKCTLNHFNGSVTPQIMLEDFEVTRRTKWDF